MSGVDGGVGSGVFGRGGDGFGVGGGSVEGVPGLGVVEVSEVSTRSGGNGVIRVVGSKKAGGRGGRGPRQRGREGVRVTQRDVELLRMLARYRFATYSQIARWAGTGVQVWEKRIPRLYRAGLVFWEWAAASRPKLWLTSREGLMFAGMDMKVSKVSWGMLRHSLALVDLGIGFELDGEVVVSEREIRASVGRRMLAVRDGVGVGVSDRMGMAVEEMALGWGLVAVEELGVSGFDQFGVLSSRGVGGAGVSVFGGASVGQLVRLGFTVPWVGESKRAGRHVGKIPDMVLLRAPAEGEVSGNIAVEVELSRKPVGELRKTIEAYTAWPGFSRVLYYCVDRGVAGTLANVVADVPGASEKVIVNLFTPSDDGLPGRTAGSERLRPSVIVGARAGVLLPVVPEVDRLAGKWNATVDTAISGEYPGGASGTTAVGVNFDDVDSNREGVRQVGVGDTSSGVPAYSPWAGTTFEDAERDVREKEKLVKRVSDEVVRGVLNEVERKLAKKGLSLQDLEEDDDGENETGLGRAPAQPRRAPAVRGKSGRYEVAHYGVEEKYDTEEYEEDYEEEYEEDYEEESYERGGVKASDAGVTYVEVEIYDDVTGELGEVLQMTEEEYEEEYGQEHTPQPVPEKGKTTKNNTPKPAPEKRKTKPPATKKPSTQKIFAEEPLPGDEIGPEQDIDELFSAPTPQSVITQKGGKKDREQYDSGDDDAWDIGEELETIEEILD